MTRPSVLVTGGAGYIGSHVVLALSDAGWQVIVLDDLSTGNRAALVPGVPLIEGDVGDRGLLEKIFAQHRCGAVMHFAGSIKVPESIERPLAYYRNNTVRTHGLLEACVAAGIGAFVFSSTAAVYGSPTEIPVTEGAPTNPCNPYGRSKLMSEQMLADADAAHGLRHIALRYFNVAGADPEGRTGPARPSASHLLTVVCEAALGRRADVPIFGDDYPTPDGTCVRDFIHVSDLADAHLKALEHLLAGGPSRILNCGYGRGYSVLQVLATVTRVSGREIPARRAPRRPGDAAEVVACSARIQQELGWTPRRDDLEQIVRDALALEHRLLGAASS